MSFSDFSSSRRAASQQSAAVLTTSSSGGLSSGRGDILTQISDVLLQYQVRHLIIARFIFQAFMSTSLS
jgi:hypothetical protein